MATTSSADGNDTALHLTESDIPGATLTEPLESHTVPELSWWLLCRGITVPRSWKKAQVLQKCVVNVGNVCNYYTRHITQNTSLVSTL